MQKIPGNSQPETAFNDVQVKSGIIFQSVIKKIWKANKNVKSATLILIPFIWNRLTEKDLHNYVIQLLSK
jgi:hypothetical protein